MRKLTEEELNSFYPKPKSFDEIRLKHKLRELRRRPRFVAIKISSWLLLGIITTLTVYSFISRLAHSSADLQSLLIAVVSFSILVVSLNLAILLYLYTLINNLLSRSIVAPKLALGTLAVILFFVGLTFTVIGYLGANNLLTTIVILLLTFLISYISLRHIINNNNQ